MNFAVNVNQEQLCTLITALRLEIEGLREGDEEGRRLLTEALEAVRAAAPAR